MSADGLRVAASGTAETKKIVWDGQAYLLETDNSNVTQVVYTQGMGGFGDLVSQRRSGATSYYLFDALGSTDRLISAAQAVLNSYIYKAFGEIAASTGSTANPFRFVGRYGYYYYGWSVGSDLYVRARWYKPVQARWLSRDPLGFAAGDWNLFRYVGNGVASLSDASGRFITDEAGECQEFMRRWRDEMKPKEQTCGKCKGVIEHVKAEARRRQGSYGRDSEAHCWAACEFGRIAGFGGWLGPLGLPTGLGGGLLAAICGDIGEIASPSDDWLEDIDAQHRGAACAGLVVSTFEYLNCDACCGTCPIRKAE